MLAEFLYFGDIFSIFDEFLRFELKISTLNHFFTVNKKVPLVISWLCNETLGVQVEAKSI